MSVKISYSIRVDLQVYKALVAAISDEGQTENDVLRDLLKLDSPLEPEQAESPLSAIIDAIPIFQDANSFYSRGLSLPDGTQLRARYKGKEYRAAIDGKKWIDADGTEHTSPSAAAWAITKTTVNGWRFWEAKRPNDNGWRKLDVIASGQR